MNLPCWQMVHFILCAVRIALSVPVREWRFRYPLTSCPLACVISDLAEHCVHVKRAGGWGADDCAVDPKQTCPGWSIFVTRSCSDVHHKKCRCSITVRRLRCYLRVNFGASRAKRSTGFPSSLQVVTFGGYAQISGAKTARSGYSGGIE